MALDADWLKTNFLAGIDLTDDCGVDFPDSMYDLYIAAAFEILEAELGTSFGGVRSHVERYDVTNHDWGRSWQTQLNYAPVVSVTAAKFKIADVSVIVLPTSWIYLRDAEHGIVDLIPGLSTPTIIFAGTGYIIQGRWFSCREPATLEFTYTAGFEDANIPALAKMVIGWIAATLPLDTAGDLIAGAGISNTSLGMDGLSQSIGTANAAYSKRIESYQKQVAMAMKYLNAKYRGPMVGAI